MIRRSGDPMSSIVAEKTLPQGTKVSCISEPLQTGVVEGPSEYEGGVFVRFSPSLAYACSTSGLRVLEYPDDPIIYEITKGSTVERVMDPGRRGQVTSVDNTGTARVRWPGGRIDKELVERLRIIPPPVEDMDFENLGCEICGEPAMVGRFSEPRLMAVANMFVSVHHVFRKCASCGTMHHHPDDHDHRTEGLRKGNAWIGRPADYPTAPLALVEDYWMEE